MSTPKTHKTLVTASVHTLQSAVAANSLYDIESFADIMNKVITASSKNTHESRVGADLLTKAFNIKERSREGDFLPFVNYGITTCGEDGVFVLLSKQVESE